MFLVLVVMIAAAGCGGDNSDRIEVYKEIFFPVIVIFSIILAIYITFKIMAYQSERSYKKELVKYHANLELFKQQALKIPVNLEDCKIIKKNNREQKIYENSYSRVFYAFDTCEPFKPVYDTKSIVYKEGCFATYKAEIGNIPITFYANIEKDEFTVGVIFAKQKKTWIYVDKEDIENYYFDLEFLDKW